MRTGTTAPPLDIGRGCGGGGGGVNKSGERVKSSCLSPSPMTLLGGHSHMEKGRGEGSIEKGCFGDISQKGIGP